MNKKNTILFVLLVFIISVGQAQSSIDFKDIPLAAMREQAQKEHKLYFVYLHADWCLPCKWMEENTFRVPKVIQYANQNYLALRLDINNKQGKYYQKKWQASILPTILIFSPQGVELSRKETSLDEDQLFTFLQENFKKWSSSLSPNIALNSEAIMDSPKPTLVVSRPALVTEAPPQKRTLRPEPNTKRRQQKTQNTFTNTPPRKKKVHQTIPLPHLDEEKHRANDRQKANHLARVERRERPKKKVFTPRSVKQYTISLGLFDDYDKAILIIEKYNNKYGHPVEMNAISNGQGITYQIISGKFTQRSAASKYLNYLNRNDIMGQIIPQE